MFYQLMMYTTYLALKASLDYSDQAVNSFVIASGLIRECFDIYCLTQAMVSA